MTKAPTPEELVQFIKMYNKRRINKKYDYKTKDEAERFMAERISAHSGYKNKRVLRGKK